MKTPTGFLIRLYPREWRDRYGTEFQALLDDVPPGWAACADLLKGAVRMQLSIPAFPRLSLVLSVAGLLAGLGISFLVTPRYVSTATLGYQVRSFAMGPTLEQFETDKGVILSRESLSVLIQEPGLNLYAGERRRMPLEDVIERARKAIRVDMTSNLSQRATVFQISFTYSDAEKARQTVQKLVTSFIDENARRMRAMVSETGVAEGGDRPEIELLKARIAALERRLGVQPGVQPDVAPPVTAPDTLWVIDPPSLPLHQAYPNRGVCMSVGFGTGFAMALLIAVFRRRIVPGDRLAA